MGQMEGVNGTSGGREAARLFERVLLIEDDSSHALIIRRALRPHVGTVHEARSLLEGLELLRKHTIDVLLSDLHLPDCPPQDLVNRVHGVAPVPVVLLTASTSVRDAVTGIQSGARDFLVKSFSDDFGELLRLSLLRLSRAIAAEAAQERLQREMQKLRGVIESSSDALATALASGEVVYANSAFRQFAAICGGTSDSLHQLVGASVQRAEEAQSVLNQKLQELSVGAVWNSEVLIRAEHLQAFSINLSVVGDERLGTREFVVWVRDVSELKRREKFQREILSTTTHDLKGPLGAISLSAELLGEALPGDSQNAKLVTRIASSARGALNMIDEFLSARRIQEGNFILKPVPCDLAGLVTEAMNDFLPMAAARSIELHREGPREVAGCVDRLGFVRVVSNLISNAIKFTPKGGQVSVILSSGSGEEVHVQVRDTGSGMEPSEVQKLFGRFSRLDRHQGVAGTGLGLFVVRSIVTAHGGRVEVQSKVGSGTTFDLSFPRLPPVNERGEIVALNFV